MLDIKITDIVSVFMVLFAVIDIFGSIPIIIDLKRKGGKIEAGKLTLISFGILLVFLFLGEQILGLFGVDISSFAIAGSFILFLLAVEMILGIELFKVDSESNHNSTIVPLAFPIIAGAGSFTTLLSLRAEYNFINIIIALALNMVIVFLVLKLTKFFEKIFGEGGILVLKKVFGIILLAISIKLFLSNTGLNIIEK